MALIMRASNCGDWFNLQPLLCGAYGLVDACHANGYALTSQGELRALLW